MSFHSTAVVDNFYNEMAQRLDNMVEGAALPSGLNSFFLTQLDFILGIPKKLSRGNFDFAEII